MPLRARRRRPRPAPARPGVPARLVYLGVAIAAHALIAQAMYGGFLVHIHAPVDQVQQGAEIMYYAGDIAELLLAAALVATWRPERRSRRPRTGRGAVPAGPASSRRRPGRVSGAPPASGSNRPGLLGSATRNETRVPAPGVPGLARIAEQPVLQIRHGEQQQPHSGQQ